MWNSSEKFLEHLNQILKKISKGVLKCTLLPNVAAPALYITASECADRLINCLYKTGDIHTDTQN